MKTALSILILSVCIASCIQKRSIPHIIFDTDIAPDYDDVGALAMLHAFADKGEAEILATISSNAFETTAPTLSVVNTYFNRADVPVGVIKADSPYFNCPRLWAQGIIAKYPHTVRSNGEAEDAVTLYRKVLSTRPDNSVTIVSVGTFSNLANLLHSKPDEHTNMSGHELVRKKVCRLVSMAAAIDSTGNSGYEANILGDIIAARTVIRDWPSPITIVPFEIGVNIFTGMKLIDDLSIQNSPVQDAYKIAIDYDGTTIGRYSWDQTAVLVAVRGAKPWFDLRKLNLAVMEDGKNVLTTGDRIDYVIPGQKPEQVGELIEELMMHHPVRNK